MKKKKEKYVAKRYIWYPNDIDNTCEVLNWLETAPKKMQIGWISIGDTGKKQAVTYRNRSMWKDIVEDSRSYFGLLILEEIRLYRSS
jgi:hypothetical protein|tara:strand:+ start:948 stop:1208 length:261 start_codon:yes stop_codon:yes gene_type:complete